MAEVFNHIFSIHSLCAVNRTTGLPYAQPTENVGSLVISDVVEIVKQMGGPGGYPHAVGRGRSSAEITLKMKHFPSWLLQLAYGLAPTVNSTPSATGSTANFLNKKGTSVKKADTGIASVTVKSGSEASVKFGKFAIKAASATTVHLYILSTVDLNRGTPLVIQDSEGRITASPLTIPDTGGTVEVPGTGLELTGGSGTVAMVTGDTAVFESYPKFSQTIEADAGKPTAELFEFGLVVVGEKVGTPGVMTEVEIFRAVCGGMPLSFNEKAFDEPELKLALLYDQDQGKAFRERIVHAA